MSIRHPYDRSVHAIFFAEYPDPAAGAGYLILTPTNVRIQIVGVDFILTTDGTAIDRYVYVAPAHVPTRRISFFAERPQNATLGYHYIGAMGLPAENGIAPLANRVRIPLGVDMIVDNVDTIIINAENLQPGDQFTDLMIYYNYWYTGVPAP